MNEFKDLISQVKKNCDISDAKYWGTFSICGLLLRLRELYRSENNIKHYHKISTRDIGEWINYKEKLWKELEGEEFKDIQINGNRYSPFEINNINQILKNNKLLYGAGLGVHSKPIFFLAELISNKTIKDIKIYIAGREYARDLSDNPAMVQDRTIIGRTELAKMLIWQRFEEFRCSKSKLALTYAFTQYGISSEEEPSEKLDRLITDIAHSEIESYIYHEIGEIFEGEKIGDSWKKLLQNISNTKSEIFARAIKDILSDTSDKGMLKHIIKKQKYGSLAFYLVFLSGFRKTLFNEIFEAFNKFISQNDWDIIDKARVKAYKKAYAYAEKLIDLNNNTHKKEELVEEINKIIKKDFNL
jgi:hypothetical protein